MASIFDNIEIQQPAPVQQPQPVSSSMESLAVTPLPPMQETVKKPCACSREARLEAINTRLSIAVHVIALIFFILGIISFIRKTVA